MRKPDLVCLAEPAADPYCTTFRLNSRDHVRERPATDEAKNSFKLFQRAKGGAANEPSSNLTTVSIRVQPLEATDLPEVKHDHCVESGITTKENQYGLCA